MIDRNKHFLRLMDWSEEKVLETIEIASRLKAEVHAGKVSDRLHGQNIAMFFEKPSLRTITTFQVGSNNLQVTSLRWKGQNHRRCCIRIDRMQWLQIWTKTLYSSLFHHFVRLNTNVAGIWSQV